MKQLTKLGLEPQMNLIFCQFVIVFFLFFFGVVIVFLGLLLTAF